MIKVVGFESGNGTRSPYAQYSKPSDFAASSIFSNTSCSLHKPAVMPRRSSCQLFIVFLPGSFITDLSLFSTVSWLHYPGEVKQISNPSRDSMLAKRFPDFVNYLSVDLETLP